MKELFVSWKKEGDDEGKYVTPWHLNYNSDTVFNPWYLDLRGRSRQTNNQSIKQLYRKQTFLILLIIHSHFLPMFFNLQKKSTFRIIRIKFTFIVQIIIYLHYLITISLNYFVFHVCTQFFPVPEFRAKKITKTKKKFWKFFSRCF